MRTPSESLTARVCLLGMALLGCAPGKPAQSSDESAQLVLDGTEADPRAESVRLYTTTPAHGGSHGGERAEQLARRVREYFRQTPLRPDGRLAELAVRVVTLVQQRKRLPDLVEVDALARQLGIVGPAPNVLLVPYANGDFPELDGLLASFPKNLRFTHFGVAVVDLPGAVQGSLAVAAQHLTLEPIPRRVAVNEKLSFKGRIEPEYRESKWVWTLPDGSTRTLVEKGGSSIAFTTEPLGAGVHRFEAFGIGPSGLEVLANFPISVGSVNAAPHGVERALSADPSAAMLELLNRARARAGVRALVRAPALDAIAQAHSADMAQNQFVGHQSPRTGGPDDRVRASGVRILLIGENVAQATSPEVAHRMLMDSPGHRQNILDPRFTHVGIGTVVRPDHRPPSISVTELFSRFPGAVPEPASFATKLFEHANHLRAQKNLSKIKRSPLMDAAASKLAARVAADPKLKPQDIKSLVRPADLRGLAGRRLGLLALFPAAPEDIAVVTDLYEPSLRSIGIGVVQGEPSADAPRTNVVVFVFSK
jgi:uncharacterized protein YkwD